MSKFPAAILLLPSDIQTMAMHLAVLGLTAQERFTLKAAIDFFVRGSFGYSLDGLKVNTGQTFRSPS